MINVNSTTTTTNIAEQEDLEYTEKRLEESLEKIRAQAHLNSLSSNTPSSFDNLIRETVVATIANDFLDVNFFHICNIIF